MDRFTRRFAAPLAILGLTALGMVGCGAFALSLPEGSSFAQAPGFPRPPGPVGGASMFPVAPGAPSTPIFFFPGIFGTGGTTGGTTNPEGDTGSQSGGNQQTTPNSSAPSGGASGQIE